MSQDVQCLSSQKALTFPKIETERTLLQSLAEREMCTPLLSGQCIPCWKQTCLITRIGSRPAATMGCRHRHPKEHGRTATLHLLHGLRKDPCGTLIYEGGTDIGASSSALRLFLGAAGVLHCQKVQSAMHCRGICNCLGAAFCRHISKGMFTRAPSRLVTSCTGMQAVAQAWKHAGHSLALSSSNPLLHFQFAIRH